MTTVQSEAFAFSCITLAVFSKINKEQCLKPFPAQVRNMFFFL